MCVFVCVQMVDIKVCLPKYHGHPSLVFGYVGHNVRVKECSQIEPLSSDANRTHDNIS